MTKNEFLEALRSHLTGKISQSDVESNIAYYSSYFDEQRMAGKSEEDICEDLGSPRIIAKNLVAAAERAVEGRGYNPNSNYTYYQENPEDEEQGGYAGGGSSASGSGPTTAQKVISTVVMIVIAVLAIIFFSRVGLFFFRLLIPIIAVIAIGALIFGFYRRR